jgi:hypothetical protein
VTEAGAPFAAGVHLAWADVPERVQNWAARLGGGPPRAVVDLQGGFSPGATSRLSFEGGDLFMKAVGLSLNPESPGLHRREARISAQLPDAAVFPRLIDSYDDGDWMALAFDAIDGHLPTHPWVPTELAAVADAVTSMHDALTPSPSATVEPAADHLRPVFGGWRRLAAEGTAVDALHGWSKRQVDRLADLESGWPEACTGDTLLHGDLRSDNFLLGPDGRVTFVDWPHAAVGNPILDVVEWAPSVTLEGGPTPEGLFDLQPRWGEADPDVVVVLVAAVSGYLLHRSVQPPPPGLPTLRAFQAAQGEVARSWLERLTGW